MNTLNTQTSLDDTTKVEIIRHLHAIRALLPESIQLTPEQRMTLPKLGDGTLAFAEKGIEYLREFPEFGPNYLKIEDVERNFQFNRNLNDVMQVMTTIQEMVSDTCLATGSRTYMSLLAYYNSVRESKRQGIPGADSIYDNMRKRFVITTTAVSSEADKVSEEKNDTSVA